MQRLQCEVTSGNTMPSEKHRLAPYFSETQLQEMRIEPIAGDASTRTYFRVFSPEQTWVLCLDPDFGSFPSNRYPFLAIQQLFSTHSVPVPTVIGNSRSASSFLIEDCGSLMLQDAIARNPLSTATLYRHAVETMISIQSIKGESRELPFNRSFDEEKLLFEFTFFLEHLPPGAIDEKSRTILDREFLSITRTLVRPEHFVLNHRDYHSRNILVRNGNPVVIDFQDARMGLPQYDAVSLLRDSYATLDEAFVSEMQRYHYRLLVEKMLVAMSFDEYLYLFDMMGFQRNVKALGTFFFQAYSLGKKEFEQYIQPTLDYLPGAIRRQPELATAGEIILNALATP